MDNLPITLGMEFESVISARDIVMGRLKYAGGLHSVIQAVTRDASVESVTASVGRNTSIFLGNAILWNSLADKDRLVTGYEIVTLPLSLSSMRKVIAQTINTQIRMGEIFSDRSSVHIHVGFPKGFIFQVAAVAMGLVVEPLLYKIAGMGYKFRGSSNCSAYCRPLALPPAIVLRDSNRFALLNPEAAITANGADKFWNYFGASITTRDRYIPLRYFGINVYSTLLRGTLEYRFFNFCSVSRYVEAVASLVQFITDLTIRLPLASIQRIDRLSIFEKNPDQDYHKCLDTLIDLGNYYESELPMDDPDIETIRELIDITEQPIFVNEPVRSHITSSKLSESGAISYGLTIVDSARPPGIIDIHTIGGHSVSLI